VTLAERVTALMAALTPAQIAAMNAAQRQRLVDQCSRFARLASPQPQGPGGVLADLRGGRPG
jgi:hypothetical protein